MRTSPGKQRFWLNNEPARTTLRRRFLELHQDLRCDASRRAAEAVCSMLESMTGLAAGVDEAGRGPLAGPVVVAAVILDPGQAIEGLGDSKKLSEKRREALFPEIQACSLAWSIVEVGVEEIDRMNILQATLGGHEKGRGAVIAGARHRPDRR